ncbi:phosphopentomutase [Desulfitispora alkaliphila]|uniref:phosphopentomutase n=1 Tax=Desulfitispora alkaliphila TaxID=622674 RepID=UPI003D236115
MKRAIIIVLDSVGVGALPDAHEYGDEESNTLVNTAKKVGGISLPNLGKMGLGNIVPVEGVKPAVEPTGAYGKMAQKSAGKDTTTGHWELAGLILDKPFPTYPNGFPQELITEFEEHIGKKTLANKPASGTAIIEELGQEHMNTGNPIVYTSADSVFQIAAHEDIIPIQDLYKMCEIARALLQGKHAVGRVIARPFTGRPGAFTRTARRKDYSLKPLQKTVLDCVKEAGREVVGIGKISDIFDGEGLTKNITAKTNSENTKELLAVMEEEFTGIVFTNLVDFDMLYGHRNDPEGYAKALEEFDSTLPTILNALKEEDLLIITADHGTDPTTDGTDHSREYVPVLLYKQSGEFKNRDLGVRTSFSDVAKTVADYLKVQCQLNGSSML